MRLMTYILLSMSFFCSCEKLKEGKCLKSAGEIVEQNREVDNFCNIHIEGDVDLEIEWSSELEVMVEAGRNLQDAIDVYETSNTLIIENHLTCNWLRDLDTPLKVKIKTPCLREIINEGQGEIYSTNTINSTYFKIYSISTAGDVRLALDCDTTFIHMEASNSNVYLDGFSSDHYVYFSGTGNLYSKDLITTNSYVNNFSIGRFEVHATDYLRAEIFSRGDIYYTGNPTELITLINGTGEIIEF